MDKNVQWYNEVMLNKTAEALKKNGFIETYVVPDIEEVKNSLIEIIKPGSRIGVGGSMTVKEVGIVEELKKNSSLKILQHQPGMDINDRLRIWREALTADYYFASPQAITVDGKMFFVDKYGNRLSAVIFGPKVVVLIAGYNKIYPDEEDALWRIRNVSAVINAHRLEVDTPCQKTGECMECNSKNRLCNVISIIHKRPSATDYRIFLINRNLGY